MRLSLEKAIGSLVALPALYFLASLQDLSEQLFKRDSPTFTYNTPSAPLGLWTTLFKNARISARLGKSFPAAFLSPFQSGPIISYYLPIIILAGILLLGAVLITFFSTVMCCNTCFCKQRLNRKYERMKPPTKGKKIFASICVGVPMFFVVISIVIHILGSNYITVAFQDTQVATYGILADANNLLGAVVPSISAAIDGIGGATNNSIDYASATVSLAVFNQTVVPPMNLLITNLTITETLKQQVIASSAIIATNTSQMTTDSSTLVTNIDSLNANVVGLNTFVNIAADPGNQYKLTAAVGNNVNAAAINTAVSNCPNMNSIFGSLGASPNLATSASNAQGTLNTAPITIGATIAASKNSLKSTINTQITAVKSSLSTGFGSVQSAVPIANLTISLVKTFQTYNTYNTYRVYGQLALMLLYLIPIMVMSISGATQRPHLMKATNLCFVPYYLLLYLFALVYLLLAVATGDVCSGVFESSNSSASFNAISPIFGQMNTVVDSCYNNQSLLTVATTLGFVKASDVDFAGKATDTINNSNFTTASTFDLGSSLTLASNPANDTSIIAGINLSSMTTTPFDSIVSGCTNLDTNMINLRSALASLYGSVTTASLTYNPASPATNVQNDAVADIKIRITAYIALVDQYRPNIATVSTEASQIKPAIITTNSTASNMITTANGLPGLYLASTVALSGFSTQASNNITAAMPVVKSNIIAAISSGATNIGAALSCQPLAIDIYAMRQGVCGELVAGFDSSWSTLFIMAIVSLLSLPIMVYFTNAVVLDLTRYQRKDDKEFVESEKVVKKASSIQAPNIGIMKTVEYTSPQTQVPVETSFHGYQADIPLTFESELFSRDALTQDDPRSDQVKNSLPPGEDGLSPILKSAVHDMYNPGDIDDLLTSEMRDDFLIEPEALTFFDSYNLPVSQDLPPNPLTQLALRSEPTYSQVLTFETQDQNGFVPSEEDEVISPPANSDRQGWSNVPMFPVFDEIPTGLYDPLPVLAQRLQLPELLIVAERLTVDQIALMDVIEAESFGLSRDSYFKLKRYFISKRKYM